MPLTKSEQFRCPTCHSILTKTDQQQVLGEAANAIWFGSPHMRCPACGSNIDNQAIIQGEYDLKESWERPVAFLAVIAGTIALTASGQFGFWLSLGISIAIVAVPYFFLVSRNK